MTDYTSSYRPDNTDKNNRAASGLAILAVLLAAAGAITMIAGLASSTGTDSDGIPDAHNYAAALVGASLLGSALSIWVLLLVFWAWRYERRNHPVTVIQFDQPPSTFSTDPPSQSAGSPRPAPGTTPNATDVTEIQTTAADTGITLTIQDLHGTRLVRLTDAGSVYFLAEDLASILNTRVATITRVAKRYGLSARNFIYTLELGPESGTWGLFVPARSLQALVKQIPAPRSQELLAFARS